MEWARNPNCRHGNVTPWLVIALLTQLNVLSKKNSTEFLACLFHYYFLLPPFAETSRADFLKFNSKQKLLLSLN
jgi:hypothetical protein